MREIKFRAWSEDYGMSRYFDINEDNFEAIRGYQTLMQYTGLKDKNGVEIYEGDKVKHSEGINYIEYDEDSAMFVLDCYSGKPLHHNMPFEIVGNEYE